MWRGLQSKEALECLTPGCAGVLMRALVLGGEAGAHKELYSQPLRGKPKAEPLPSAAAAVAVRARWGQGTLDASEALCIKCGSTTGICAFWCWVLPHAGAFCRRKSRQLSTWAANSCSLVIL